MPAPEAQFNPPPGWPTPPPGWRPGYGWQPDPTWPPIPEDWELWIVPAPKPPSALMYTLVGLGLMVGVLLIGGVGFTVWSIANAASTPSGPDPDVPVFATLDESLAYFATERGEALAFADEHVFGYDYALVQSTIDHFQPLVDAEANDPSPDLVAIATWGHSLDNMVAGFEQQIARWENQYAPDPGFLGNVSDTPAEAALDSVSGGVSDIVFDDYCGEDALACVGTNTLVHVPEDLQDYTDSELTDEFGDHWSSVMLHEFGHVVQNKYYYRLLGDPEFQRLFVDVEVPDDPGYDYDYSIEHSADCMGAVMETTYLFGYPGECTPEQLDYARTIWDGSFYTG